MGGMSAERAKKASAGWAQVRSQVKAAANWETLRKAVASGKVKLPTDTQTAAEELVANVLKQAEELKERTKGKMDVDPYIKALTEHKEAIAKQVRVLMDTMKSFDLEGQFEKLKEKAGITGDFKDFATKFQEKHADKAKEFREKFLEDKDEEDEEEEEDEE